MKIIITQDQVKLIKESTNKSVGLLKKFYHIEADGSAYRGHNQIQTFVVISPKDWDNPLTPKSTKSFCNWEVVDDEPIHKVMTIPEPSSVPMMEHIGNTDELAEYLAGIHREEAERMIQRLNHRKDNPLNENVGKNKKFLINHMGQDFTDKIKQITSSYDVPMSFDDCLYSESINRYLNHWGPMYLVNINGKKYLYQNRGEFEWFMGENCYDYVDDEILEELGIDVLGLRFKDIIDMFFDEKESLNEEESDKPDWLKRNTKVESLLKKLFENKEYDFSFKDKWEDLDGHIETYTFHYHIEILNAIGVGSDTIARVQVIIDDILVDGESVYDDWVDNDYSNDVWYINNLENHLDEEFFDVFPFSIYVNFYGHDEER